MFHPQVVSQKKKKKKKPGGFPGCITNIYFLSKKGFFEEALSGMP